MAVNGVLSLDVVPQIEWEGKTVATHVVFDCPLSLSPSLPLSQAPSFILLALSLAHALFGIHVTPARWCWSRATAFSAESCDVTSCCAGQR